MSLEINGNKIAANYTANSQITIYGGAVIIMGFLGNSSSNTITNFKIGTTSGASDVYNKATLSPFEVVVLSDNKLLKQFFSINTDQILYITADNWNGGTVGMTIFFDFVFM